MRFIYVVASLAAGAASLSLPPLSFPSFSFPPITVPPTHEPPIVDPPVDIPCGNGSDCPDGLPCVPNDRYNQTCVFSNDCEGTCGKKYPYCGGFSMDPPKCNDQSKCIGDSRYPYRMYMIADLPGICIPKDAPQCGGFAGRPCPSGLKCYDDPSDSCNPLFGGADCMGLCF